MLKAELKKHIGLDVIVILFNNEKLRGKLGYVDSFSEEHNWKQVGFYYIDNYNFRASHVKKLYICNGSTQTRVY